jgi:hypothetical protein
MAIIVSQVAALSDFIEKVFRLRDAWQAADVEQAKKWGDDEPDPVSTWFRGQGNARWSLQPKLYRSGKKFNENEIRTEFKLRAFQLMSEAHVPHDDREWYFLMQHYGAPTRLLDWTDGALIALYFAVQSQGRHKNAAVWMIDPSWLNHELMNANDPNNYVEGILLPYWGEAEPWFPEPFEQALHVTYPVAMDPPHVARRVSVQRSRFTVHGNSKRGLESFLARTQKPRLAKFVIPKVVGKEIFKDLSTCGITETSVYPDLGGLSKELETKWAQLDFATSSKLRKPPKQKSARTPQKLLGLG